MKQFDTRKSKAFMGIISEQICPKGFDIIWGLCTDIVNSKIRDAAEQKKINEKLESYLSRKLSDHWFCTQEEEIDFEGLANYIREDLMDDIKIRLFGEEQEREFARKKILEKAVIYANAKTNLSMARAQKMVNDVMEMLKKFWRTQVPRELQMMSGEIVDDINRNVTKQTQQVVNEIINSKKEINKSIDNTVMLGLDKNVSLLKSGDIGVVEDNINTFMNTISAEHQLPGYFRYEIRRIGNRDRLVSVPINREACELYPPKIKGIADFKIDGVNKELWSPNIFDYANRHQLNITMTVRDAEKVLGKIKDPSQVEAEVMKGKDYIILPKPFPPAFPCSIMGDGKTIINYLLLRTIDISDDGVCTITNDEQKDRQFKFTLKFNVKNKKMDYSFSATGFGNRGRLEILKAMKALRQCNDIEIYLLEKKNTLITGRLSSWNCPGRSSVEDQISFYEHVLDVEKYFKKELNIPDSITKKQIEHLEYISALIRGDVCKAKWKTLSCDFEIDEKIKKASFDLEYGFQHDANIEIDLWGSKFVLPIRRLYVCVKIDHPERLKQKLQVLDIGDVIKITFVPGSGGNEVEDRLISG